MPIHNQKAKEMAPCCVGSQCMDRSLLLEAFTCQETSRCWISAANVDLTEANLFPASIGAKMGTELRGTEAYISKNPASRRVKRELVKL